MYRQTEVLQAPKYCHARNLIGIHILFMNHNEPSDGTTGETISHPTKQPEDGCQVVGYSHSTRLAINASLVTGYPGLTAICRRFVIAAMGFHGMGQGARLIYALPRIDLINRNNAARSPFCTVLASICPPGHRKVTTVLLCKSATRPGTSASLWYLYEYDFESPLSATGRGHWHSRYLTVKVGRK